MQITWYGHSAFRLDFAGNAVLIDPFFSGNPAFVSDKAAATEGVSHILLTHGHADHVGDALDIAKANGATVTTNYDLCMWLVWRFRSPHHSRRESEMRTSEPKPH